MAQNCFDSLQPDGDGAMRVGGARVLHADKMAYEAYFKGFLVNSSAESL